MTTVAGVTPWWEWAARAFEVKRRRWHSPGAMASAIDVTTRATPALDAIDRALVDLSDTPGQAALGIYCPPQEGKSQRVSRRYATWLLDQDPTLRVAIVSYELDIALRWGRDIKNDVVTHGCAKGQSCEDPECKLLHIEIRKDTSAAGRWETPQGGGVYCVGIGGPLAGKPVDILIIDDPVKDRAAAESAAIRKIAWDWWESVALPRLGSTAKVVLVMTRWHEDDLAGRIASRPSPLPWSNLTMAAIAMKNDPLGRAVGAEFPSARDRPPGYFRNLQANLSSYVFAAIYQQAPTAAEGNFFRRATFRYWRHTTPWADGRDRIDLEGAAVTMADTWRFATVDVAASTRQSADYTVVAVWAVSISGDLILLDRTRAHSAMQDHFALVLPLRERWGFDTVYVEKGFFASTLVEDARQAGVPVWPLEADKDKITRAIPAAGRLHAGKVWFPAETSGCECGGPCTAEGGAWLDEWCDELASFDKGAHDDQVDAFAYAARVVTADWRKPTNDHLAHHRRSPYDEALTAAHSASVGGDDAPDFMTMDLG